MRGTALMDRHDFDRAISDFSEAIRLDQKNVLAYNARGQAWRAKGELDRAILDLTKAIAISPLPTTDVNGRRVNFYVNRGIA
jgi:Flp pilus assembly protein TadD